MNPVLAARMQDAAAHAAGFQDSVRVESPLPGGLADVVRFIFHVPQWIQIGGAILAIVVATWLGLALWRRRDRIVHWVRTRSRAARLALLGGAFAIVAACVMAGTVSWNYMQHDNDFCTGCHVMGPAYQAFTASEHADLLCHDCHQQSIWASSRQLVMWVAERPEDIDSHADIPDALCQDCHSTGESETWAHVEATAGHRVHFESDDPSLEDVTCLTCHAPEVHQFSPVDQTCGQAGCHEDAAVRLGGMADQTALHCAACHEFTVDVPALATIDSAASSLVPTVEGCTGCHQMRSMLSEFEPELEPHGARCGVCHNAHEQTTAEEAGETCAACHDDWRTEPFHVGSSHRETALECTLCHVPHASRVDASDCAGCHARVAADPGAPAEVRRRLRRVEPFDTAAALLETRAAPIEGSRAPAVVGRPPASLGLLASGGDAMAGVALLLSAPADSFEHSRHDALECLACHTTAAGHGGLTFEAPRGCQICHHRAPARSDCADCHVEADDLLPAVAGLSIRPIPGAEAAHRVADFSHSRHASVACTECHTTPVSLAPPGEVAGCASCHERHHAIGISCSGCHATSDAVERAHSPPQPAHEACGACHTAATVATLVPDRPFCLTCHEASVDHEPEEACTTCHLQASPVEYRPRLAAGEASES